MSLRDRGYKPYQGAHTPLGSRWRVVLAHALRSTARQPWVIAMLILAGFPVVAWAAWIGFVARKFAAAPPELTDAVGLGALADPGQYVYAFLVSWYGAPVFAFLMALFAGGGAIADDSRTGAFQFYFSRPLSREQYLAGKLLAVLFLTSFVCLGPALLLALVRVGFSRDFADAGRQLALGLPRAIALGAVESVAFALPVVALSSLSKGRGYVQGAFAAAFMLPWIFGAIFTSIFRSPWPQLLSLPAHLSAIGAALYGVEPAPTDYALPWFASAIFLAALAVGSLALVRARLAAAEVVAS